ncbi:MAG: hypothetical protein ACR2L1_00025 [Pyrinomonadaceae bacterium]
MDGKELFEDYEIGSWQPNPRLYQILGASLLVHLLFLVTISQFNLLQAKACDSAYIGKVCEVLDAAYLSSVLLGQDTKFSERDYEKTEIDGADITYIDVSRSEPPLEYPAGYFALANPESAQFDQTGMPTTDMNGFPTSNSPSQLDLNQPQILPTPNNNVTNQPLPDKPFDFGGDFPSSVKPPKPSRVPAYRPPRSNRASSLKKPKIKNDSPAKLDDLGGGGETANNNANANTNRNSQVAKNDAANANKPKDETDKGATGFNQKPLKDFGAIYGEKILNKDININAPFTIEIRAGLDENGKLVNPKLTQTAESDPKMSEVAQKAILAFGDSQVLKPLYDVGGRSVIITFAQDKDNLQAIIKTETKSETQAKILQSGLNLYVNNFFKPKEGSDEQILMKKANFATQGKSFIINFQISNDEKNMMIERSLKNLKDELQKKGQPNSLAVNKDKTPKG